MRNAIGTVGLLLAAGCNAQGAPVPVRGNAAMLVGEWTGDYRSSVTGRAGSIVFKLQAGKDTAYGDILMIPNNLDRGIDPRVPDPTRRTPQILHISFVGCEGADVSGWIEPYQDPDTGEKVYTSFQGVLKGNVLEGTFVTRGDATGPRLQGKWQVKRKPAASK